MSSSSPAHLPGAQPLQAVTEAGMGLWEWEGRAAGMPHAHPRLTLCSTSQPFSELRPFPGLRGSEPRAGVWGKGVEMGL